MGATDVKDVDTNYLFLARDEKASNGCVGEGTYMAACEDNLRDNARRGGNQRSQVWCCPASLLTAFRKM
jgi:hypothetical protein